MKMLLQATMPNEAFNESIRAGSVQSKISRVLEAIHPEAVYFTEIDGQRGCLAVVEVADASKIPALAEPFFLAFNATVRFHVCMTPDDLRRSGLDELGKNWGGP